MLQDNCRFAYLVPGQCLGWSTRPATPDGLYTSCILLLSANSLSVCAGGKCCPLTGLPLEGWVMLVSNEGLRREIQAWACSVGLDLDALADVAYRSSSAPSACGDLARSCTAVDTRVCAGKGTGAHRLEAHSTLLVQCMGPAIQRVCPGGTCQFHAHSCSHFVLTSSGLRHPVIRVLGPTWHATTVSRIFPTRQFSKRYLSALQSLQALGVLQSAQPSACPKQRLSVRAGTFTVAEVLLPCAAASCGFGHGAHTLKISGERGLQRRCSL